MKLATHTDYSLRLLIYLGKKEGERSTVAEIAEFYQISQNHLVKVAHNLAKLGVINSFKGKGGGLVLAMSPSDINIGKLTKKLGENSILVECFGNNNTCNLNPSCKLKGVLLKASNSFYKTLEEYSLEDILKDTKVPI